MSLTSPGRERVFLVSNIPAEVGKISNLFYSVYGTKAIRNRPTLTNPLRENCLLLKMTLTSNKDNKLLACGDASHNIDSTELAFNVTFVPPHIYQNNMSPTVQHGNVWCKKENRCCCLEEWYLLFYVRQMFIITVVFPQAAPSVTEEEAVQCHLRGKTKPWEELRDPCKVVFASLLLGSAAWEKGAR